MTEKKVRFECTQPHPFPGESTSAIVRNHESVGSEYARKCMRIRRLACVLWWLCGLVDDNAGKYRAMMMEVCANDGRFKGDRMKAAEETVFIFRLFFFFFLFFLFLRTLPVIGRGVVRRHIRRVRRPIGRR